MKNSMAMDLKDSPCPVASQTNPISRFHPLLKWKGNQKIEKRRLVESCCQLSFVIWITWILYIYWLHSYNMKKKLAIMLFFALPVKIYHSQRKVSLISFKWSKPVTSITTMLIKTGPLNRNIIVISHFKSLILFDNFPSDCCLVIASCWVHKKDVFVNPWNSHMVSLGFDSFYLI